MKNRLLKSSLAILCAVPFLVGCTQNGKENTQVNNKAENNAGTYEVPDEYKKEVSDISFNIDKVEVPDDVDLSNIKEYIATKQKPDVKSIIERYSQGRDVTEKDETDDDSYCYMGFSDGSELWVMDDGYMTWMTKEGGKPANSFDNTNMDKYAQTGSFDFMDESNAVKAVSDELKACGYNLDVYEYKYFLLDHDTMAKEEKTDDNKAGTKANETADVSEWTKEDDCYWFYINQKLQGIPVYFGDENFPDDTDTTSMHVSGIVSANGIEALEVSDLYDFQSGDKTISFTDFDSCAQTVANKYGEILSDTKYIVDRAKLYFVPQLKSDDNYDLVPAWLFEIKTDSGNEFMIVDAESGKEITL